MKEIKFAVKDMHCSMCVMRLESLEDELPGIQKVTASYQKQQMKVEFDEKIVQIEQIIEAIKELGYSPEIN